MGDIQTYPKRLSSSMGYAPGFAGEAAPGGKSAPIFMFLNVGPSSSTDESIQIKEPTIEEAKAIIAKYFAENDGREIDYVELFEALNIDLQIIVSVCAELEAEGKIG